VHDRRPFAKKAVSLTRPVAMHRCPAQFRAEVHAHRQNHDHWVWGHGRSSCQDDQGNGATSRPTRVRRGRSTAALRWWSVRNDLAGAPVPPIGGRVLTGLAARRAGIACRSRAAALVDGREKPPRFVTVYQAATRRNPFLYLAAGCLPQRSVVANSLRRGGVNPEFGGHRERVQEVSVARERR
jgi:hypothetical protein